MQRLRKHKWKFLVLLIIVLLEGVVFNFNAFHLLGGDYPQTQLDLEQATVLGFTKNDDGFWQKNKDQDAMVEFADVGVAVGTITVVATLPEDMAATEISVRHTDETASSFRGITRLSLIRGNARSQTTPCQFSGKVGRLQLSFAQEDALVIQSISVNQPIRYHISGIRLGVMLLLAGLVWLLFYSKPFQKPYTASPSFSAGVLSAVLAVFVAASFCLTFTYTSRDGGFAMDDFRATSGNQITQEIVEAFAAGQVSLLAEPSEELLAMENPYDWGARSRAEVSYLWDHCLYEGKYYSYYGIAPVLFLFLPYHLLTGYFFPSSWAVLLFGIIGLVFLKKLYLAIVRKWFPDLSLRNCVAGLVTLFAACGIWFSFGRPLFYELAIAAGFAAVLAGCYFLFTANVLCEGEIRHGRLFLGCNLLALAVLCRPTLAVYCVAALVMLAVGLGKLAKKPKPWIRYLACSLVPFAVWGSVQMVYNYLRFGSFFDFGIQYSLTINDFTRSQFHVQFVLVIVFAFLFAAPALRPAFPFVFSEFQRLNTNGYLFVDESSKNGIAIGLLWRALPVFAYFLAPKAYRLSGRKKEYIAPWLVFCILAPLVILCSAWESGYAVRYAADFSWQMTIGALLVLFVILQYTANETVKRILSGLLAASTFACLAVNFAQVYSFMVPTWTSVGLESKLLAVQRLFEFWR